MNFFKLKKDKYSRMAIFAIVSTIVFFIAFIFGEGWGGNLGLNQSCYPYIGCASGFFGFDGIEHFISGFMEVCILFWVFKEYPKYSLLSDKPWKNILIFIALVAFIGVIWEFVECTQDIVRMNFFHEMLIDRKLHINLLLQPNNIDTMGDLFLSICGAVVALFFTKNK